MFDNTRNYAQTLTILAAIAVVAHYLIDLDWPWALFAGALVATAAGAVVSRRRGTPGTPRRTRGSR